LGFESEENQPQTQTLSHFPRKFHLWDLPRNRIFARLDDDFRRELTIPLIERFGEAALSELIDMGLRTLREFAIEDSSLLGEKRTGYIQLDVLFRLAEMAERRVSLREIETHVTALKGYGCSLPAFGMRLPFIENRSMIRLLMHFIGDGFICSIVGSTKVSTYTNRNARLREGFMDCLNEIFGDVSSCVRERVSDQKRSHVRVPKWMPYLLVNFYPDAIFGQLQAKLPSIIFSLPRELKIEAIRTLADDDGSVQELCIRFVSGSSALLDGVRKLILQLIQDDKEISGSRKDVLANSVSPVRKQRNWYRLDLGFQALRWYNRTIGFSHPEKARELDFRIKAAQLTRHSDALARDFQIFSDLSNARRTAQEIAFAHLIREEYVHESLNYHSAHGRVIKCGQSFRRKKAAAQWRLTREGRSWFQTLCSVNRNRTREFMRKTLTQRDFMRYRWLKHESSRDRRSTIAKSQL
jgi:hypothetical protein